MSKALQRVSGTTLKQLPKDRVFGLRHAVGYTAIGVFVMGPGCGAIAGSFYGDPVRGFWFGLVVLAVAMAVVLPTVVSRGVRRRS